MITQSLRIVTRKSPLALAQTHLIKNRLHYNHPELEIEIIMLTTTGDRFLDQSLQKLGGKGLFIKELEHALIEQKADLAVHSMKDMPAELPSGLALVTVAEREVAEDVLVSQNHVLFSALPAGSRIGTSSLRRASQLLALRSDLQIKLLRGNVFTRLSKLYQGEYEAIVLAQAGLHRLNLNHLITEQFSTQQLCPAIGQGALGLEYRQQDDRVQSLIQPLLCYNTSQCVEAERSFGAALGANCHTPIGAYATIQGVDQLCLDGFIGDPQGAPLLREQISGPLVKAETLGQQLAQQLRKRGADHLL